MANIFTFFRDLFGERTNRYYGESQRSQLFETFLRKANCERPDRPRYSSRG